MAKLMWLFLAFTMSVSMVSANVCSNIEKIMNCNECFRCGGHWCKDPKEAVHCVASIEDTWCPMFKEMVNGHEVTEEGDLLDPKYVETTAFVTKRKELMIRYEVASKPRVTLKIMNTTQNHEFSATESTNCQKKYCSTVIDAIAKPSFCSPTARTSEYVSLKVTFDGLSEESLLKYKVPCACECSDSIVKHARECNGQGDFSCGVCSCYDGWNGPQCSKPVCEAKRGDVRCNNPNNNLECSGNGVCGPCETCICYTDRVGSKYFNKDYYCADICMTTNDCDLCLRDPTPGRCWQCHFPLFYQNFNDTLLDERDDLNRSIWVMCNETMSDGYHVEYVVMRNEQETYFMIPPSKTNQAAVGGGGTDVALPLGLTAFAILAAVAAVAGYMYYKSRLPPVPMTDSMYTNIDAEDCTGENPLYKSPMSSFKNPTYGKW